MPPGVSAITANDNVIGKPIAIKMSPAVVKRRASARKLVAFWDTLRSTFAQPCEIKRKPRQMREFQKMVSEAQTTRSSSSGIQLAELYEKRERHSHEPRELKRTRRTQGH